MTLPDGSVIAGGLRCRRATLERAIREAALATAGLTLRPGKVERVTAHGGRADGIHVDGASVAADLVVDASGRVGRVCEEWRAPTALGGDTGIAYVDRQYQLLPGAEPGPSTARLRGCRTSWASRYSCSCTSAASSRCCWCALPTTSGCEGFDTRPPSRQRVRRFRAWPCGPTPKRPGRSRR